MCLADECPLVWVQLYEDWVIALEREKADEGPKWRKPGEKAVDARDRLRQERAENKRRMREAQGHVYD